MVLEKEVAIFDSAPKDWQKIPCIYRDYFQAEI